MVSSLINVSLAPLADPDDAPAGESQPLTEYEPYHQHTGSSSSGSSSTGRRQRTSRYTDTLSSTTDAGQNDLVGSVERAFTSNVPSPGCGRFQSAEKLEQPRQAIPAAEPSSSLAYSHATSSPDGDSLTQMRLQKSDHIETDASLQQHRSNQDRQQAQDQASVSEEGVYMC